MVELAPEGAAITQLKAKGYADRDRGEPLIGVEFSKEARNLAVRRRAGLTRRSDATTPPVPSSTAPTGIACRSIPNCALANRHLTAVETQDDNSGVWTGRFGRQPPHGVRGAARGAPSCCRPRRVCAGCAAVARRPRGGPTTRRRLRGYLYLPRLREPAVLLRAVAAGVGLLTWENESFARSYDEDAKRYRGLLGGQVVSLTDVDAAGVLVKPDVARRQLDAEQTTAAVTPVPTGDGTGGSEPAPEPGTEPRPPAEVRPRRFHGSVSLDATRAGRDASRIADEVITHLAGLVRANVTVTLEIDAEIPDGAPDHVVRTVTENSRTLKFNSHGFERE